jgi:putative ABC transport system permease protein
MSRRRPRAPVAPASLIEGPGCLAGLTHDTRDAVRALRGQPGPAVLGAAAIALGVAAVTLISGIVWHVLLKPLPWTDADRLVRLYEGVQGETRRFGQFGPIFTNGTYLAWQDAPQTIEALAAWRGGEVTLSDLGSAERLPVAAVTASLASLLGVSPALGRWFEPADARPTAAGTCVLSHALWLERFGGDPRVLGARLRLDGEPVTVIGVMPRGFAFPDRRTRAWRPLHVPAVLEPGSGNSQISMFSAMARLRPGATPLQAAAEATARARATRSGGLATVAVFGGEGPIEVRAVPALEAATRTVRPALVSLLLAVALLLAISAANVGNVQLVRLTARRREFAVRSALGANSFRLGRQLFVESLLVGAVGGVAGLLLALAGHRLLPSLLPADFPRVDAIVVDWRILVVAVVVATGAGLVTGLVPAWQSRRVDLAAVLTESAPTTHGGAPRMRRLYGALMTAQVAGAVVLLAGAVLLTRSFVAQLQEDRGFDTANVLTAALPIPDASATVTSRNALLETLVARLREVPGVSAAAFTSILPLTGSESMRAFTMAARREGDPGTVNVSAGFRVVSPGYFAAMRMRIVEGRPLEHTDSETSRPVVVVNRAFARSYLDDTPLGEVLPDGDREVVGIVEDVRADLGDAGPEMYVASRQWSELPGGDAVVVVRTSGNPHELAPLLRAFVRDLDPTLALGTIRTLEDRLDDQLARPRLYSVVIGGVATLALVIACVGLFGVLSYSVVERSRELAVRAALGATTTSLLGLVARESFAYVLAGLALGVLLCLTGSQLASTYLYGVEASDLPSYVIVVALVAGAATLASLVPASRAARLDPSVVLREG